MELPSKLAHKLAGRIITIQMYGGSRTHLVGEAYDGQDSYWFAIKEDAEEKEESEIVYGTLPVPGGAHADDYAGPCCGLQL